MSGSSELPEGGGVSPTVLDAMAAGYTVLSRLLLGSPSQETLEQTRRPDMLADWPVALSDNTARGIVHLARSREANEDATAVKRDYNRLFVGPDKLLAPPYESVHRSREGLVFEAETMQVRAFYARFGLAAPRLDREPDDHIGLEFELMATLCLRALDALEDDDDDRAAQLTAAQAEFLREHLLAWAPDLMQMIQDHADTEFYRGVGALGAGLLEFSAVELGMATRAT